MGRTTYWMNVSVDLRIEHTIGESGGGSWMRIDEELHREFNRRAAGAALLIEGRVIYEIMESYWPTIVDDESETEVMRDYARIWVDTPKLLVSRTRTTADHNTRVLGEGFVEEVARLREELDGPIHVGGATVATQLLRAGLLDELMLFVHPVVLGAGRPVFDDLEAPVELDLLEQATYGAGVALHRYAVRRLD